MTLFKSEGVVLHTVNFRDSDQIVTVFSQQEGMIKLLCRRARSKKGSTTQPLAEAEFVYLKGRSEIYTCQETTIISHHMSLRSSYNRLTAAFNIAKALLHSQDALAPAPQLYQLLTSYLRQLGKTDNPKALVASFQLKLLRHDGLFQPMTHCSICQNPLTDYFLDAGECFCSDHRPPYAMAINHCEAAVIEALALSRSFSAIAAQTLTVDLEAKIDSLFKRAGV